MNAKEETDVKRYSHCNNVTEKEDLIFLFPDELYEDPDVIANAMQKAMDFLKKVTGLDPKTYFSQRVVIAYRHVDDEGGHKNHPVWTSNRISIPWSYLGKKNEPLDCCTHELAHPFYRCSPLHDSNEGWGEGFCEFLRGPLKKVVGLDGDRWWQKMIKATKDNLDSSYAYPAGQFVLKAYEYSKSTCGTLSDLIGSSEAVGIFIKFLFTSFKDVSLSTYLTPSHKMIKGKKKI